MLPAGHPEVAIVEVLCPLERIGEAEVLQLRATSSARRFDALRCYRTLATLA